MTVSCDGPAELCKDVHSVDANSQGLFHGSCAAPDDVSLGAGAYCWNLKTRTYRCSSQASEGRAPTGALLCHLAGAPALPWVEAPNSTLIDTRLIMATSNSTRNLLAMAGGIELHEWWWGDEGTQFVAPDRAANWSYAAAAIVRVANAIVLVPSLPDLYWGALYYTRAGW